MEETKKSAPADSPMAQFKPLKVSKQMLEASSRARDYHLLPSLYQRKEGK